MTAVFVIADGLTEASGLPAGIREDDDPSASST
jgi:hypothetical protein